MGTKLKFSTAYHPQTDGQTERTIQTLEDMLRASAIELKGSWDTHLSLAEFAYNNNYHASIQMAPYEALYGRKLLVDPLKPRSLHPDLWLKKYHPNPSHVIELEEVKLRYNLTYPTEPERILDIKDKQLRNKTIRFIKVFWKDMSPDDATWETEEQMRYEYPYLFS
ncbi:uncharacterized protein LOC114757766 [Neltuma alba]|uniref:uncharacterized protein LOC114757766 n=1 Tax=Neltuma alba TaxID=207710 RepID=UPI0010A358AB|nr:uncharacterized protein LOC114757766 [Prosopis alba]